MLNHWLKTTCGPENPWEKKSCKRFSRSIALVSLPWLCVGHGPSKNNNFQNESSKNKNKKDFVMILSESIHQLLEEIGIDYGQGYYPGKLEPHGSLTELGGTWSQQT